MTNNVSIPTFVLPDAEYTAFLSNPIWPQSKPTPALAVSEPPKSSPVVNHEIENSPAAPSPAVNIPLATASTVNNEVAANPRPPTASGDIAVPISENGGVMSPISIPTVYGQPISSSPSNPGKNIPSELSSEHIAAAEAVPTTSRAQMTTTDPSTSHSHLAPITIFGLAIGSIIALIVTISIVLLFFCRRRRRRLRETNHINRSSVSSINTTEVTPATANEKESSEEVKRTPEAAMILSSLRSASASSAFSTAKSGRHITWQDEVLRDEKLRASPPQTLPPPLPPRVRPPVPRSLILMNRPRTGHPLPNAPQVPSPVARRSISLPSLAQNSHPKPKEEGSILISSLDDKENVIPAGIGSPGPTCSSYYGSSYGDEASRRSTFCNSNSHPNSVLYSFLPGDGRRALSENFSAGRASSIRSSGQVTSHRPSFVRGGGKGTPASSRRGRYSAAGDARKRYSTMVAEELSSTSSTGSSILNYSAGLRSEELVFDLEDSSPISAKSFEDSTSVGGLTSPSYHHKKSKAPIDSDDRFAQGVANGGGALSTGSPAHLTRVIGSEVKVGGVFEIEPGSSLSIKQEDSQDVFVDSTQRPSAGGRHFSCGMPTFPRRIVVSPSSSPPHTDEYPSSVQFPPSSPPDSPTLPLSIRTPDSEESDPFNYERQTSTPVSPKTADFVFRRRARESVYSPTLSLYYLYSSPDLDIGENSSNFLTPFVVPNSKMHRHSKSWTLSSSVVESCYADDRVRPFSAEYPHIRRSSLFYPWDGFEANALK